MTQIERRLLFILDDLSDLRKALIEKGVDTEKVDIQGIPIQTYLNNIEIACDLKNDESDRWILK